jgi:DNA-binding transcriptional regulator LsrR (DeoR family)
MARETNAELWQAYEVAKRSLAGMTQEAIGAQLGISRGTVASRLKMAQQHGIILAMAIPPLEDGLQDLRDRLIHVFGLREVVLVRGHPGALRDSERETIFHSAARAAANLIDKTLLHETGRNHTLCLAWGHAIHAVAQFLSPVMPQPHLRVTPLVGVLTAQPDVFEANSLVQTVAAKYDSHRYHCLPIPAIVRDPEQKAKAIQFPIVKEVLHEIRKSTFVVTSIAVPNPKGSAIVRRGMLEPQEVSALMNRRAVGEICAHFFDRFGQPVANNAIQPIGLSLQEMQDICAKGGRVMAIVAGDRTRVPALLAAIEGKIINTLVTDHETAKTLLQRKVS